jgi:hypothetical protein
MKNAKAVEEYKSCKLLHLRARGPITFSLRENKNQPSKREHFDGHKTARIILERKFS